MSSMKFRRTCGGCNATFFTPDRRAVYCPKCLRKKQEQRQMQEFAMPRQHSGQVRPGSSGLQSNSMAKSPATQPPAKQKLARPPKTAEMSEELRSKIEAAYYSLKDSVEPLRKLHAKISHDLWVRPLLVAEVTKSLRQQPVKTERCTLSDAERRQVIDRYLYFIRSGERLPEGRRNTIAKEMNLPTREVVLAVREWSNQHMGQLSRKQLFEIEKEYWHTIEVGNYKFADLPQLIAEQVKFATADQVARWLDQLHDDTKISKLAPGPSEEQTARIIEEYHQYLQQGEPPEESLHWTIARKLGMLPNQIHRVLCEYRCRRQPK